MKRPTEDHYVHGLRKLAKLEDRLEAHRMADTLVCEFLMGNGNCEIVKEFRRVKK